MKQLKHENILPFYGLSGTVSNICFIPTNSAKHSTFQFSFCQFWVRAVKCFAGLVGMRQFSLVFPWYENGNVMNYLKKNPDVDRYILVSTFPVTSHFQRLLESHEQPLGTVNGPRFLHRNCCSAEVVVGNLDISMSSV